jgi:hypothetical protein
MNTGMFEAAYGVKKSIRDLENCGKENNYYNVETHKFCPAKAEVLPKYIRPNSVPVSPKRFVGVAAMVSLMLITLVGGTVRADAANTASASASITIVTPITITNSLGMLFGQVSPGTALSHIKLDATGTRTLVDGDAVLSGGTTQAASFSVSGTTGASYSITSPSFISLTDGTHTMQLNTFGPNSSKTSGVLTGGADSFTVGGVVNVNTTTLNPPGVYSASGIWTVQYQ